MLRTLLCGHRPAACAWPSAVSLSRSRAASSFGSPGIRALVPGLAVCRCTLATPNAWSSGPACTSTYCMRPYGTTTRVRNISPRRMYRSSSRSAYPHQRALRPIATQPATAPATATVATSTRVHSGTESRSAATTTAASPTANPTASIVRRIRGRDDDTGCQTLPGGANRSSTFSTIVDQVEIHPKRDPRPHTVGVAWMARSAAGTTRPVRWLWRCLLVVRDLAGPPWEGRPAEHADPAPPPPPHPLPGRRHRHVAVGLQHLP